MMENIAMPKFKGVLFKDEHSRYRSFEITHNFFKENYDSNNPETKQHICLHLYAFLANWGMVARGSILMQKDYLFILPMIDILLDKKYRKLMDFNTFNYQEGDLDLIIELGEKLSSFFKNKTYFDTKGSNDTRNATGTLITKILLVTYSCCPAYDNYVRKALGYFGISASFSKRSLKQLCEFSKDHQNEITAISQELFGYRKTTYSSMKIMDMFLWELGFDKGKGLPENVRNYENIHVEHQRPKKVILHPKEGHKQGYRTMLIRYIENELIRAESHGLRSITLVSGEVAKAVGIKNAIVSVCLAMNKVKKENDVLLNTSPSGFTSRHTIEYKLPRT